MNKQKKPLYWYYIVILVVLLLVNMIIGPMFSNSHIREVTYSDFLDAIEEKEIQDVEVHDTEIYYTLKGDEGNGISDRRDAGCAAGRPSG